MTNSRLEDEAAVYVVFDLVGLAQELYLFVDCLLKVLLDLVGMFSLYVV